MSDNNESVALTEMKAHAGKAAALLKAMANENRLLILCHLHDRELSVSELNAHLNLSQSALSQHLAILRRDGLVETRRESQTIYYSLSCGNTTAIIHTLESLFIPQNSSLANASPC